MVMLTSFMGTSYYPGGRAAATRRTAAPTRMPTGPSVSSEARQTLQKAIARYEPGGGFGAGVEAGLERGRTKALASGMQNLVSAGLAGTTIAGGLGKKYEEEVAAPTRLKIEDIRAEKVSSLQTILAQMEQSASESELNRNFQAAQSQLSRQFQASQAALGRRSQATRTPGITPTPAPTPAAPAAPTAPTTAAYTSAPTPQWGSGIMKAATSAYQEPPWATFNGQRYEMGASGQVRSSIPSGLLMAGAM